MGAPCINDTCSITSKIDPTSRKLEHSVILAEGGGIECVNGLRVKILGDPAAASPADVCFQQLGINTDGDLWSVPERAKIISFGSPAPVTVPNTGGNNTINPLTGNAVTAAGLPIVNPFDCPAIALIAWRLRLGYTIPNGTAQIAIGADSYAPFGGQLQAQLLVDGDPKATTYMDVGGMQVSLPANRRRWEEGVWAGVIGAGATWSLNALAEWQIGELGVVQRFNVNAEVGPSFVDRGFRANGQVIIMPFGGE